MYYNVIYIYIYIGQYYSLLFRILTTYSQPYPRRFLRVYSMLFFALPSSSIVGKTMPFLPPMTGNGLDYTYKNGDFPGGWCVYGLKFYPHSEACCGDNPGSAGSTVSFDHAQSCED